MFSYESCFVKKKKILGTGNAHQLSWITSLPPSALLCWQTVSGDFHDIPGRNIDALLEGETRLKTLREHLCSSASRFRCVVSVSFEADELSLKRFSCMSVPSRQWSNSRCQVNLVAIPSVILASSSAVRLAAGSAVCWAARRAVSLAASSGVNCARSGVVSLAVQLSKKR